MGEENEAFEEVSLWFQTTKINLLSNKLQKIIYYAYKDSYRFIFNLFITIIETWVLPKTFLFENQNGIVINF